MKRGEKTMKKKVVQFVKDVFRLVQMCGAGAEVVRHNSLDGYRKQKELSEKEIERAKGEIALFIIEYKKRLRELLSSNTKLSLTEFSEVASALQAGWTIDDVVDIYNKYLIKEEDDEVRSYLVIEFVNGRTAEMHITLTTRELTRDEYAEWLLLKDKLTVGPRHDIEVKP